jgi:hypothetical protein
MKLAGSQSWTFGHGIAQLPHAAQGRALPTVIATWHLLAEWSQSRGMAERQEVLCTAMQTLQVTKNRPTPTIKVVCAI